MTSPAACAASATPSPPAASGLALDAGKEDMAFLRSFYVADDIWRFAWSLIGCLLALSWLPPPPHTPHSTPPSKHRGVSAGDG